MPLYKYVANRALTAIENLVVGQKLSEYHTGYRAFSRRLLETLPLKACGVFQTAWARFACATRNPQPQASGSSVAGAAVANERAIRLAGDDVAVRSKHPDLRLGVVRQHFARRQVLDLAARDDPVTLG